MIPEQYARVGTGSKWSVLERASMSLSQRSSGTLNFGNPAVVIVHTTDEAKNKAEPLAEENPRKENMKKASSNRVD